MSKIPKTYKLTNNTGSSCTLHGIATIANEGFAYISLKQAQTLVRDKRFMARGWEVEGLLSDMTKVAAKPKTSSKSNGKKTPKNGGK